MTLVSDYTDDFEDGSVDSAWQNGLYGGSGPTFTESGGQLTMHTVGGSSSAKVAGPFEFPPGDRTSLQIGSGCTTGHYIPYMIQRADGLSFGGSIGTYIGVEFPVPGYGGGTVHCMYANDDYSETLSEWVSCNTATHPWLRVGLADDGSYAYWDASTDGEDGNWERIKTFPIAGTPATFDAVVPHFELQYGGVGPTTWDFVLASFNLGSATPGHEPGPRDKAHTFADDFEDDVIGDWFLSPSGATETGGAIVLLGSGESETQRALTPNPTLDISEDWSAFRFDELPSGGSIELKVAAIGGGVIGAVARAAAAGRLEITAIADDATAEIDHVDYVASGALDGWIGIRVVGDTFTIATSPDGAVWTAVMAHTFSGAFTWDPVLVWAYARHGAGGGAVALLDWNTNGTTDLPSEAGGFGSVFGGDEEGGGGGEEPGVPALLRRRAYLALTIDGETPTMRPLEGLVQMDFRQLVTRGNVVLEREAPEWDHDLPVELAMGAGTNDVTRMSGILWEPGWALYPNRQTLALRGKLAYLERYKATEDLTLLALTGTATPTDKTLLMAVLDLVAAQFPLLTYDAGNLQDSGFPLGTVNPTLLTWKRGRTAASYVEDLMRVSVGRRLVERLSGTLKYIQIVGRPSGLSEHAFTQGVDVHRDATSVRTIRQAANHFTIRGLTVETVLGPFDSPPYLPDTITVPFDLQSDWIQAQDHADAMADYWKEELLRELVQADYSTARDDSLEPGQRIALNVPKVHVTEPVWLPRVTCAVRGGKFRQRLGTVGGGLPAEPGA